MADANETRDWRIDQDFALSLMRTARKLYAAEGFGVELKHTVYTLDSTTIDLCLALFSWARLRKTKGAVKLHTLLDLRGNIPSFIHISDGNLHDVNILDQIAFAAGRFHVMDRGCIDFSRPHGLHQAQAFFVVRAKANLLFEQVHSRAVDKTTGLRCDQTIRLAGTRTLQHCPLPLRRVKHYDAQRDQRLVFLTNHFDLPALTIAELYRCRWQVELFFKWIKQHLRIKAFFGTSEMRSRLKCGSRSQSMSWSPSSKKRLRSEVSLYTLLQIFNLTLFEKTSFNQLLENITHEMEPERSANQLDLFNSISGH